MEDEAEPTHRPATSAAAFFERQQAALSCTTRSASAAAPAPDVFGETHELACRCEAALWAYRVFAVEQGLGPAYGARDVQMTIAAAFVFSSSCSGVVPGE